MDIQSAISETIELWKTDPTKSKYEIEVINKYGNLFNPTRIDKLTAEEYKSFLNFKNNKHWTGLERAGYRLTEDMGKLKNTLRILLDDSMAIDVRIKNIRDKRSPNYLPWFGTAYYTPILLVVYPEKYPVVNAIVKNALQKTGLYVDYESNPEWVSYPKVIDIISDIAKKNGISLWQMDWVWWRISKIYDYESLRNILTKIYDYNMMAQLLIVRAIIKKGPMSKEEIDDILSTSGEINVNGIPLATIHNRLIDELNLFEKDNESDIFKLNLIRPLELVEKENLVDTCNNQISVLRENKRLLEKKVSETHVKILEKFFTNRGKYLPAEKIYGVKRSIRDKKSALPPDEIVDHPHYMHNLITGVFWPSGDEYALSIQLNPKSKWELEIDRDYPTLRINYDFGPDQKYAPQIKKLENCYNNDIPIGIIFKTIKSKNKILGLGKITSFNKTNFIIDSYRLSEEESKKLKEETIEEFDKSISDPEIARIEVVNYEKLLTGIDFNNSKFLDMRPRSPDTRRVRIDQVIDYCESGEWVIPKFQRYFDWKKEHVRDFLRSIFLNYYVGAFLLWDVRKEKELDVMAIYGVDDHKGELLKNSIILDGQQRITSLYYAIKSPDFPLTSDKNKKSYFYIDFNEYFTTNDTENLIRVSFEKIDEKDTYKKMLFPIYNLSDPYPWLDKFESYVEQANEPLRSNIRSTRRIIENKLRYIFSNFEIPYVTLPEDRSLDQVTEIFEKINSSGKQLDIFDLLIARLSKYEVDLRELWDKSRNHQKIIDYEGRKGEKKLPIYILQSLALCYSKSKSCKRKDILNIYENIAINKDDFEQKWSIITQFTMKAIDLLENTKDGFGVIQPSELPFEPVIPVLTALLREVDENYRDSKKKCFDKIENWYWTSVFSLSYSSAVDSQKTLDYKEMLEWFSNDHLIPKQIKEFRSKYHWQVDLKNIETESNAIYKGVLSLIAIKGGKDFDNNKSLIHQKYHKDHIFPKSKLLQREYVNSILNITWLSSDTNQRIKHAKDLSVYIGDTIREKFNGKEGDFLETLNSHFINNDAYFAMKDNNFEDFVNEREKTILKEIGKRIGADELDKNILPSMTTPYTPYTNIKIIRKALEECRDYIYWIDKYFSLTDLDILAEANLTGKIKIIRILISLKSSDERMRNNFIRFRKEMKLKGIESEMRVVADSKTYSEYHDRWVLSKNVNYNLMSGDTAKRGQYAEIKKTENVPPFEKWWKNSLDIIDNFHDINGRKSGLI